MQLVEHYSHLNGLEYLQVHRPALWEEVQEVTAAVDAEACKTKVSQEQRTLGETFYSPSDMNKAFTSGFKSRKWAEQRNSFWVTADAKLLRSIYGLTTEQQRDAIMDSGYDPIRSYNQTDFVKERVAVEVQFGKYSFVAHDLFVKHLSFYVSDIIDVGIEILPMKSLERQMSSGVAYYERDLLNVIRQGRGVPAVPLVLIGVAP